MIPTDDRAEMLDIVNVSEHTLPISKSCENQKCAFTNKLIC